MVLGVSYPAMFIKSCGITMHSWTNETSNRSESDFNVMLFFQKARFFIAKKIGKSNPASTNTIKYLIANSMTIF